MSEDKSDPPDPALQIYVTKDACYKTHLRIERRLTRVEAVNIAGLVATIATFVGIVYMLWKVLA